MRKGRCTKSKCQRGLARVYEYLLYIVQGFNTSILLLSGNNETHKKNGNKHSRRFLHYLDWLERWSHGANGTAVRHAFREMETEQLVGLPGDLAVGAHHDPSTISQILEKLGGLPLPASNFGVERVDSLAQSTTET